LISKRSHCLSAITPSPLTLVNESNIRVIDAYIALCYSSPCKTTLGV
jgi:hypothetical protein